MVPHSHVESGLAWKLLDWKWSDDKNDSNHEEWAVTLPTRRYGTRRRQRLRAYGGRAREEAYDEKWSRLAYALAQPTGPSLTSAFTLSMIRRAERYHRLANDSLLKRYTVLSRRGKAARHGTDLGVQERQGAHGWKAFTPANLLTTESGGR